MPYFSYIIINSSSSSIIIIIIIVISIIIVSLSNLSPCSPQAVIEHATLKDVLEPIRNLYEDVHRKALMRLEYEGLHKSEVITTPGARYYNDPAGFAMDRYAYYVCFKCNKAYYGGEARCDEQMQVGDDYNPAELVCGACSDVSRAQVSVTPHMGLLVRHLVVTL